MNTKLAGARLSRNRPQIRVRESSPSPRRKRKKRGGGGRRRAGGGGRGEGGKEENEGMNRMIKEEGERENRNG